MKTTFIDVLIVITVGLLVAYFLIGVCEFLCRGQS
jgi:hypothetical protein